MSNLNLNDAYKICEGGLRTRGHYKVDQISKPLISVITVVFNGALHLSDTILSVINQTYDNIEYIIIDGGSSDGTIDIIREYDSYIDYWISEPDSGIYFAMNKGISFANGIYIGILNSDDFYESNTISSIVDEISRISIPSVIYGNMNLVMPGSRIKLLSGNIDNINKNMTINHPTCFVSKYLYKERMFNLKYKIAADYELMLYYKFKNKNFVYINKTLTNMRVGGVSANNSHTYNERFDIHVEYFNIFHAYYYLLKLYCFILIRDLIVFLFPRSTILRLKGYK